MKFPHWEHIPDNFNYTFIKGRIMSVHEDLTKKADELVPAYLHSQGSLSAARFKVLCERIEQDEAANAKALADFSERIEGEVRVRKEQDARMLKRVEAIEAQLGKPKIAIDFESQSKKISEGYFSALEKECAALMGITTDILMGREPYAPWPAEKYPAPKDTEQRAFNAGWDARKAAEVKAAATAPVPAPRDEKHPDYIATDKFGKLAFIGDLIMHSNSTVRLKLKHKNFGTRLFFTVEPGLAYYSSPALWAKSEPSAVRDKYHPSYQGTGGKFNEVLLKGDMITDCGKESCELISINGSKCTIKAKGKFSILSYERDLADFWLAAPAAAK